MRLVCEIIFFQPCINRTKMLSLDKGKPLFFQVLKTTQQKIETIRFSPNARNKKSDLEVERPDLLLSKNHWKQIKKKHMLSAYNIEQLKRHLKNKTPDKISSGVLHSAYESAETIIDDILKNSLIFDDAAYTGTELIPVAKNFTVISIVGPSGSGKSTMAAKIIEKSMRKDDKVFLLSRTLRENDPAFENIEDRIENIDVDDISSLPSLEDMSYNDDSGKGHFLLVDDIEAIPKQIRDVLYDFIDSAVTTGRKLGIRIIFSSHLMSGYLMRHVMNESRLRVFFPGSNKWKISQELRLKYGLPTAMIQEIFQAVKNDHSRVLILQTAQPFLYATERRVVLL